MTTSTNGEKGRSIKETKTRADEGPHISKTHGKNISEDDMLYLQLDDNIPPLDNTEQDKVDTLVNTSLLNAEDSRVAATLAHEKTKAGFIESEISKQNNFSWDEDFHGFDLEDVGEEEYILHGFEM